jgi:hypothetical protein
MPTACPAKTVLRLIFFLPRQMRATGDHDGLIVQGIVDVRQSGVGAIRGLIDFDRAFHGERFVQTLVVEDIHKFIKAGLLLQKVRKRRLGGFFLQSEMHAFMTAVLLRPLQKPEMIIL